jgi:hypothetical protein
MSDIRPPRLTARLFTTDRASVEVPDLPAPAPAASGRIKFEITYPAGEKEKTIHRVAVINRDTGAIARRSIMPVVVRPGENLTVEFTADDIISHGLMAPEVGEELLVSALRHPASVTADALLAHYEQWHSKFTGEELDAISKVRHALHQIAEGER